MSAPFEESGGGSTPDAVATTQSDPTESVPSTWEFHGLSEMPARDRVCGYELLGRLAAGGVGEVLLARRADDGTPVAIKRLLPDRRSEREFMSMFRSEAEAGLGLEHANLCRTLDFQEAEDGSPLLVMEWVDGVSLRDLLMKRTRTLPITAAVRVVADAARGLHYVHNATNADGEPLGMVHRDVSPHNIMLGFRGQVKILDFGIAKHAAQVHSTRAGVIKGKYAYMAPEQCLGRRVDPRTDVYALGMCLYMAIGGTHPFVAGPRKVVEVMRSLVHDRVPSLRTLVPAVPEALDALILSALAKSPDDRPASAAAFADALDALLAERYGGYGSTDLVVLLDHLVPVEERHPFGKHPPAPRDDSGVREVDWEVRFDREADEGASGDAAVNGGPGDDTFVERVPPCPPPPATALSLLDEDTRQLQNEGGEALLPPNIEPPPVVEPRPAIESGEPSMPPTVSWRTLAVILFAVALLGGLAGWWTG